MTNLSYSNYHSPADILEDEMLTRDTMLSLLRRWKEDENALHRAAAEGLNGGKRSRLRSVQKAIDELLSQSELNPLSAVLSKADLTPLEEQVLGIFGTKQS